MVSSAYILDAVGCDYFSDGLVGVAGDASADGGVVVHAYLVTCFSWYWLFSLAEYCDLNVGYWVLGSTRTSMKASWGGDCCTSCSRGLAEAAKYAIETAYESCGEAVGDCGVGYGDIM